MKSIGVEQTTDTTRDNRYDENTLHGVFYEHFSYTILELKRTKSLGSHSLFRVFFTIGLKPIRRRLITIIIRDNSSILIFLFFLYVCSGIIAFYDNYKRLISFQCQLC